MPASPTMEKHMPEIPTMEKTMPEDHARGSHDGKDQRRTSLTAECERRMSFQEARNVLSGGSLSGGTFRFAPSGRSSLPEDPFRRISPGGSLSEDPSDCLSRRIPLGGGLRFAPSGRLSLRTANVECPASPTMEKHMLEIIKMEKTMPEDHDGKSHDGEDHAGKSHD